MEAFLQLTYPMLEAFLSQTAVIQSCLASVQLSHTALSLSVMLLERLRITWQATAM